MTTGKRRVRRGTFDIHTDVLSYHHHRLNCRHSSLSVKHGEPQSLSNPPTSSLILPPFPCHSPLSLLCSVLHHLLLLFATLTLSPSSFLLYLGSLSHNQAGTFLHLSGTHTLSAFANSSPPSSNTHTHTRTHTHTHTHTHIYMHRHS